MAFEVPPPEALPATAGGRLSGVASLALIFVSLVFAVSGQLTLKAAMNRVGPIGKTQVSAAGSTIGRALREPRLWVGLTLFGISAVFWLIVLSNVALTVAYPFVGLSYVVLVLFGRIVLHEDVPPLRWAGVAVIALGVALVGFSFRRTGA